MLLFHLRGININHKQLVWPNDLAVDASLHTGFISDNLLKSWHTNVRLDYYPALVGGRVIVFGRFVSLFRFFCQQHYEKMAGLICIKFSGKVWSDHGTT